MNRLIKNFLNVAFIVLLTNAVYAQRPLAPYAKDELLIKFKSGTNLSSAMQAPEFAGSTIIEDLADLNWKRLKLSPGISVESAMNFLANNTSVESIQPNFYYHLLNTPNDPQFSAMYGLQRISAPTAWDQATGSATTVVAIIDTGIKYSHEDLAANMWTNSGETPNNSIDDDGNGFVDDYFGYDFFFNDPDPLDENGHGTHTAGTVGAVGNNSLGVVGVNWNVRLMAIKIYNNTGYGTTSSMLINAYNYIRMMKNRGVNIRVTNNSYGGCDEACGYDQATKDAIDALGDAGVLNIFAAGNAAQNIESTPFYPASYTSPSIMSVASSDQSDNRSGFSNYGLNSVDVASPGTSILSTVMTADNYGTKSGTSMATPHVAGAAALLSSFNPSLSAMSLKATLMNTVDQLAQWNGIVKTGGRINVARALQNQTTCNLVVAQNPIYIGSGLGLYSINVSAPSNCDYSAVSNAGWMGVTVGNPSSGNSSISFAVVENFGITRTGTIKIGDVSVAVIQRGFLRSPSQVLDFDGDGRTDYSAIQDAGGGMYWHNLRSTSGYSATNFGRFADDIPVPNDFDGDGKTDIAVWRSSTGTFYVLRSSDNSFFGAPFGTSGDDPLISQDFDGDGRSDFAITRPAGGSLFWYVLKSSGSVSISQFGLAGDRPVRGDFDGDGQADLAIYRTAPGSPANTFFVLKSSSNALSVVQFGISSIDRVVSGDFDGDAKADVAVWRTSTGEWHYLKSSDGSYVVYPFGLNGDLPTPGDYDGDGKTDFSVWRQNSVPSATGTFYVLASTTGFSASGWGNVSMLYPANGMQVR